MRRTILSAVALACTAVLAGTAPAFADDPSPVPTKAAPAQSTPSPVPSEAPTKAPTPSPSKPGPADETPAPAPADGQVSAVPEGAPDTGVATP
ncbi:Tat pathway signal sequence domain protein, partial [Streptomyces sp. SID5789]|uniref:Tat pathway signal sequence domain protein n=2 Tax=unclassified Streptomyces TaxID=2593676 RepID=UPI00136C3059